MQGSCCWPCWQQSWSLCRLWGCGFLGTQEDTPPGLSLKTVFPLVFVRCHSLGLVQPQLSQKKTDAAEHLLHLFDTSGASGDADFLRALIPGTQASSENPMEDPFLGHSTHLGMGISRELYLAIPETCVLCVSWGSLQQNLCSVCFSWGSLKQIVFYVFFLDSSTNLCCVCVCFSCGSLQTTICYVFSLDVLHSCFLYFSCLNLVLRHLSRHLPKSIVLSKWLITV